MSLSFACACGRRYKVDDHLAGKAVRCKQCGETMRVPRPTAPDPEDDIYGLDETPAAPEPEPEPAAVGPGRRPTAKGSKGTKSKGAKVFQGFLESIPRGEDLLYPLAGLGALFVTLGLALFGGFVAVVFGIFVILGAVACFLWASGAGLKAAFDQGASSALILAPGLVATAWFCWSLARPSPGVAGSVTAALAAAVCFAAFFAKERRGEEYRRPIAIGMLSMLLGLSFLIMLVKVRWINNGTITPDAIQQASDAPQPGQPNPSRANPAPATGDVVARALEQKASLTAARRGFQTRAGRQDSAREPVDTPPPRLFQTVRYESPVGPLAAYLTPDPGDGKKHPAIVWITGGDSNTIGDVWTPSDPRNDQNATAYRQAGIVTMFPSLRGGNDNPGTREGFLGEVEDVLAAAEFLAGQDYVDPERIYLGGHSTGGTLVLLVAEMTDQFRAVFSFGPVNDVRGYGGQYCPFPTSDLREVVVRSPGYWLHSVRCPTFVIEGEQGNIEPLRAMERDSKNPLLHFHAVKGANHFNVLSPTNLTIARKILRDAGPTTTLSFTPQELNQPFGG